MAKGALCLWLLLFRSLLCRVTAFAADINNIRLNKVFKDTHSRRKADSLIADGRVKINGQTVNDMGRRVVPFQDLVELDGIPYTGWEIRHGFDSTTSSEQLQGGTTSSRLDTMGFEEEYIKYWKPVGVTSTTDQNILGNLIDALQEMAHPPKQAISQRIFSVGRLDKDSSGLLLLTSDGRLPNAVLRKEFRSPKTYRVTADRLVNQQHIEQLRAGLVITTDTVRQGKHKQFTAPTLPCHVVQLSDRELQVTLTEGRNRQIRVMFRTVGGYTVKHLHRINFMGIDLSRLSGPGDWTRLNEGEFQLLTGAMERAAFVEYKLV